MKIAKKIITFLLLSILLTSNSIGLHFYIVDHTNQHDNIDHCQDNDNNPTDDEHCDLCLLTYNLSHLNFHSPSPIAFKVNEIHTPLTKNKILGFSNLQYKHYLFKANRNKAPPSLT